MKSGLDRVWAQVERMQRSGFQPRGSLIEFKARLVQLPISVAHAIAVKAAPELTRQAAAAYDSGRNVYGEARPRGRDGRKLTLVDTGETRARVKFVRDGTIIRCALGTPWAKYLIGKYKILPIGDRTAIPAAWTAALDRITQQVQAQAKGAA